MSKKEPTCVQLISGMVLIGRLNLWDRKDTKIYLEDPLVFQVVNRGEESVGTFFEVGPYGEETCAGVHLDEIQMLRRPYTPEEQLRDLYEEALASRNNILDSEIEDAGLPPGTVKADEGAFVKG